MEKIEIQRYLHTMKHGYAFQTSTLISNTGRVHDGFAMDSYPQNEFRVDMRVNFGYTWGEFGSGWVVLSEINITAGST